MPDPGPFERHVREAIALNRARRPGYVARGGTRAALVSRLLVGSERALLPIAERVDRHADALGQTAHLDAVLVPMSDASPPGRPVAGSRRGGAVCARLASSSARPLARIDRALRQGRHEEATCETTGVLDTLRTTAEASGLSLALSIHLAESAALGASRVDEARALVPFVRLHLLGMPFALALDALAAPLHAEGIGLLVNDLPPVPAP